MKANQSCLIACGIMQKEIEALISLGQLDAVRSVVPKELPLFSICGAYDLLAKATPEEIRTVVRAWLDQGVTFPVPPADIYPPAKIENILAFVDEARNYAICR